MKLTGDKNRCPSCLKYFNSTAAFDKHRTGDFDDKSRRCMTEAEMRAKGMDMNAGGWWITAKNPLFS